MGGAEKVLPKAALAQLEQFLTGYCQQFHLILLTESEYPWPDAGAERFWCLLGETLSLLVIVRPHPQDANAEQVLVQLCVDPSPIGDFLENLLNASLAGTEQHQALLALRQNLAPSTLAAQADFMLAWLETCTSAACRPVQARLDQQLDRSLLLNQVVTKIQESLDLPAILQTTVEEVRQFLEADRLVIYQFDLAKADHLRLMASLGAPPGLGPSADLAESATSHQASHTGYITYESRASEQLSSVLHYTENFCFQEHSGYHTRYLAGETFAVNDVSHTYHHAPCLLTFLQQAEVKSKVVVPIVVGQKLWGLLIVHQCRYQRHWGSWEIELLQHIAEHLAIAVNQAQLYQQLQRQTQNLEVCVIERTQDLRDALAAAQSANRAKSEFLATMSHELRTPLTSIIGMSATLLRWSLGDLSPRQRDYLNTIHTSGEHLLTVINDILEVSKIESGRTVLEVREFSLTSLSRQSIDAFRLEASRNNIDVFLDLKLPAGQDAFGADPRRVRQMLANLLSNAIKFTPPGGKVTLRVRREQNVAVFQIEDTGIGIPAAAQPLLFEKFQQLENVRQREYQGTGLGLALTQQLVELHGGSIKVTSEVGVGSVFTIRIPLQRLSDQPLPKVAVTAEPIIGRIVLVEDNEESASVICDMLTAADYQVIWIVDGSRVLDQVELLQPMAVITNISLDSASGYDIIEALRRRSSILEVKILALLDTADADAAEQALRAGANDIIIKPIDPTQILATVNALMTAQVI